MGEFTDKELNMLGAAFARSNIGFGDADVSDFTRLLQRDNVGLWDATAFFCQQYVEADAHMDMFMNEAKGWKKRFAKRTYQQANKEFSYSTTWANYKAAREMLGLPLHS